MFKQGAQIQTAYMSMHKFKLLICQYGKVKWEERAGAGEVGGGAKHSKNTSTDRNVESRPTYYERDDVAIR